MHGETLKFGNGYTVWGEKRLEKLPLARSGK